VVGPVIGVLALQGAFAAHEQRLAELGASTRQIRTAEQLDGVGALVMPGGESTTMSNLLTSSGLFDAIKARLTDQMPVFGTCAGMILLATEVLGGRPDQRSFGAIDLTVRRNGYGRQIDSFETDLTIDGTATAAEPFHAVFIRAPVVESVGEHVEVLARHQGVPVLARQGAIMVASFHPELTRDPRLHARFLRQI
jgi:5'-phosphate synthase pdxT subunit